MASRERSRPTKSPHSVSMSADSRASHCHNNMSSTPSENGRPRAERMEQRLENTVSLEDKQRIDGILKLVGELSDVQKLLLYLKLPTGNRSPHRNEANNNLRPDHVIALNWLRTHLQLDANTCLPKQDILDEYRLYCERHDYQVISQADFGKLVKQVFPDTKTRRLGQRGQSRYPSCLHAGQR
ncbi:DNA-binding protein RFX5 [Lamellibrachia satsuma]|nr:DNA-binding protein RFX5 [Lamellibrachia satsuma]